MLPKRVYTEINLDIIRKNVESTMSKVGKDVDVLVILKADAYGHGAIKIAQELSLIGINNFGVATAEEAIQLRNQGISGNILLLDYAFEENYETLIDNDIINTVFQFDHARRLNEIAKELNKKALVHLKLDTGMGRIGFIPSKENLDEIKKINALENIEICGIYSHLACADCKDKSSSNEQIKLFKSFVEEIEENGVILPVKHICNSAGIIDFSDNYLNMVRNGIITYGLYPSDEVNKSEINISPAMSMKSHVVFVKEVEKDFPVSYGSTYITEKKTKIATIPIGYADGYPRALSNKGSVLIAGKKAPIIGRICMDQMMVDVTDIGNVKQGDLVTVIGKDGENEITVDDISEIVGTINYEILCNISKRVPRVYVKNNKVIDIVNLIK